MQILRSPKMPGAITRSTAQSGHEARLIVFLAALPLLALPVWPGGSGPASAEPYPPAEVPQAAMHASNGEYAQARDILVGLLERRPDDPRVAERLVRVYRRLGKLPEGVRQLDEVALRHPEATAPLDAAATLLEVGRQREAARERLREAVRRGTRHPSVLYHVAASFVTDQNPEAAAALVDSLLQVDPGEPSYMYAKAAVSWMQRDWAATQSWAEQTIDADPYLFDAYLLLGNVQHQDQATTASYRTWEDGLRRAGEAGDQDYQFRFLERLGEAYWNAVDPRTVGVWEEAIVLGEQLGELDRVEAIRTKIQQIELTLGHYDRVTWWGLLEVSRALEKADTTTAVRSLGFLAGMLALKEELTAAAGLYETALRLVPLERNAALMGVSAARLARLRLLLGQSEAAQELALRVVAASRGMDPGPSRAADLLSAHVTAGHAALFRGGLEEAESLYQSAIDQPARSEAAAVRAEAGLGLNATRLRRGNLAGARQAIELVRMSLKARPDSLLSGTLLGQELDLLSAEGNREGLSRLAREILGRPGSVLPVGVKPRAALHLAELKLPGEPKEGIDLLIQAWLQAEKEASAQPATTIPRALLPDPEEPLERLALFFAQLAIRPGETPTWTWKPAEDSSHQPQGPAGVLAARWSYFFAERRAHRVMESHLAKGQGAVLPATASALRLQAWEEAAARCAEHALALTNGKLPDRAPAATAPLLEDLFGPARSAVERNVPQYARVPWMAFPVESSEIQAALAASGATSVRFACLEPMSLVYILQGDRIRLVSAQLDRAAIARVIQGWTPYGGQGCATPPLTELPTDFRPAGDLFHQLLGPVGESADLSRTVWISADGPLWYLPFESLPTAAVQAGQPDSRTLLEKPASLPLAVDQYQIAYLLDPGCLARPATAELDSAPAGSASRPAGGPAPLRVVLPSGDDPPPGLVIPEIACWRAGHAALAEDWMRPPCQPLADDLDRLVGESPRATAPAVLSEAALREAGPAGGTVYFCPTLHVAGQPWGGGLILGARRDRQQDNIVRWNEFAALPGRGFLALPEATVCPTPVLPGPFSPSASGFEVILPVLAAQFAGYSACFQAMWNAGEAVWMPLAGLLREDSGPSLEAFQRERARLRTATLPAGSGHEIALGHPYFSCATRWWQLGAIKAGS